MCSEKAFCYLKAHVSKFSCYKRSLIAIPNNDARIFLRRMLRERDFELSMERLNVFHAVKIFSGYISS